MKAFLLGCLLATASVDAHRALLEGPSCFDDFKSSHAALRVEDPSISWYFDHYFDCRSRAVWLNVLANETSFYFGAAVTILERFQDVRASAVVIGPDLGPLSSEQISRIPGAVLQDDVFDASSALLLEAPQDQSTCNHIGATLRELYATVENNRCVDLADLRAWPVLDVENIRLTPGQEYHIAVFLQENESAKVTIGLGTWQAVFNTPYTRVVPTCPREMADFFERDPSTATCFPAGTCPSTGAAIGCVNVTDLPPTSHCPLAEICGTSENCMVQGKMHMESMMMGCGGQRCPGQVHAWETVNMKMHMAMMDLEYTGNPMIDFVRNMIPHHNGAVDMCDVLLTDLTCTPIVDIVASDTLQGLEHFCAHVRLEQSIEVTGMRQWLSQRNLEEASPCPTMMGRGMDMGDSTIMDDHMAMMTDMSCGFVEIPSSKSLIKVNHQMMEYMAVEYSCDPLVDFTRQMIPHHEAAIAMCDVLVETGVSDNYLLDLCHNITYTQYAEIAWMNQWLESNGHDAIASCIECSQSMDGITSAAEAAPCEDLLPTSSFCHDMGGGILADGTCKCDDALEMYPCGATTDMASFGVFHTNMECSRTCGLCPERQPPFSKYCPLDNIVGLVDLKDDGSSVQIMSLMAPLLLAIAAILAW